MKYKQFSPELVIRTADDVKVPIDDPEYLAWLDEGNSPFPPDPPIGEDLNALIEEV